MLNLVVHYPLKLSIFSRMKLAPVILVLLIAVLSQSLCATFADNQRGFRNKCQEKNVSQHRFLFPGLMTELPDINPCSPTGNIKVLFIDNTTSFAVRQNPRNTSIAVYENESSSRLMCVKNNGVITVVNVTLYYCRPGFFYYSKLGTCECLPSNLSPSIGCSKVQYSSGVVVGHCVSRSSGKEPLLVARCAFAYLGIVQPLVPIEQNDTTGATHFCEKFKRKGKLCSECIHGNGLSVFSDTFNCIPCSGLNLRSFALYLTIEIVPTTIFVLIILFFHIGITTGPANGYIFFAQMVTTQLEVLFLKFGWKVYVHGNSYLAEIMPQWIINPYCIWNLTFYRMFNANVCLSPNLRVVHLLALHLVMALYPLLLMLITYVIIELKARNIRFVTWLWRLMCFNCVRCRRVWQAKTSVIDAFASCVLLSYTKFVLVSMLYLSPSEVHDGWGRFVGKVLSLDTSVVYFSHEHVPYVVVAIVMLLTFGALPPLILTFYQFRLFQSCLERVHLRGVAMQRFVEAFQGCYRDGTDGTIDCRFFAGVYFIFRCVLFVIMAMTSSYPVAFTAIIITLTFFLLLIAIFRPYKKQRYNIVDSAMIFLLISITALQLHIYYTLRQTLQMSHLFIIYHFLLALPLVYISVYIVNWLYRRWKQRHNYRSNTPGNRQPDFRESALEERVPLRAETASFNRSSLTPNPVSQTEVSIENLSDEEERNEGEIEGQGCRGGGGRCVRAESVGGGGQLGCGETDQCDSSHTQVARERPRFIARRELQSVAHYGSIHGN